MKGWKFISDICIEDIYNSSKYLKESIEKEFSILDLGFKEPSNFIYLNYKFPITEYIGIEKADKSSFFINKPVPEDHRIPEEFCSKGSFFDEYKKFHNYYGTGNPLTEEQFEKTFNFYFEKDALNYLRTLGENNRFNLIVISDLLHLLVREEANDIINKSFYHLKSGGLMYIQIYQQTDSVDIPSYAKPYSITEINEYLKLFKKIHVDQFDNEESKRIIIGEK